MEGASAIELNAPASAGMESQAGIDPMFVRQRSGSGKVNIENVDCGGTTEGEVPEVRKSVGGDTVG
jgi:hypothetical protein